MSTPRVCKAAVTLIIQCEVTSRVVYEKSYSRPLWPGGNSGVTIGIGFDLGYQTVAALNAGWPGLPEESRDELAKVVGLKGGAAKAAARDLHEMDIPWDDAVNNFTNYTLPKYADTTAKTFPGSDKTPPECFGALVSLVYNRGSSLTGDSRKEMATIHDLILAGNLTAVPEQFRSMKRLWPDTPGLCTRREQEAQLWETGLKNATATA